MELDVDELDEQTLARIFQSSSVGFDPEYDTVLDVKGARGIEAAQWVLTNLSNRDVTDVHIRIEVHDDDGNGDVELPNMGGMDENDTSSETAEFESDRPYENPSEEVKEVSAGSRPHRALVMLAEYEDADPDDPWADTQSLYDRRPGEFRNPQDLSAALSTLFNEKALVVRSEIHGQRGYLYRPTIAARQKLEGISSPF